MDNVNWLSRLSKGPAAAHAYLSINNVESCQLTLDWSYDGVYFKYYNDQWVVLSIGLKTITHEIEKLDTENKIQIFKYLSSQFLDKLKNYSEKSNNSLMKLKELTNLLS